MMNSSSLSRAEWIFTGLAAVCVVGAAFHAVVDQQWQSVVWYGASALATAFGVSQIRRARRSFALISTMIDRASRGDLENRITALGDGGEILRFAQGANRLLDGMDTFVRETRATLAGIRDGKHHRRIIERGMVGSFRDASRTMNQAVSTIEGRLSGFSRVMGEFEATIGHVTGSLGDAVAGLSRSAAVMRSTADDTESRSTSIGASAEETSVTVATVASATEQLSAAVEDIARQAEIALSISAKAGHRVEESRVAIADLSKAVVDIVDVVGLIRQVAEQTKLLALNATIEAARAGEAGRGFGVVASEVKALADQTASATHTIAERIQAVENRANRCMTAIEGITGIVAEISEAARSISASVQEQGTATQEISHSMQMASTATDEVSANVTNVALAAGETGRIAGEVAGASGVLADQTERLRASVHGFLERAYEVAHGGRSAA